MIATLMLSVLSPLSNLENDCKFNYYSSSGLFAFIFCKFIVLLLLYHPHRRKFLRNFDILGLAILFLISQEIIFHFD
jgi:hypothetical protein